MSGGSSTGTGDDKQIGNDHKLQGGPSTSEKDEEEEDEESDEEEDDDEDEDDLDK